ncbi:MAG: hypothetical protein HY717_09960 [Planctomycetes bacterium]|nr:hypothetical protein [Planctomycetota bacterium]
MRRAILPSRPAAFILKAQTRSLVEVREGPKNLLVAETFALVPFWKAGDAAPEAGKEYGAIAVVEEQPERRNRK